MDFNYCITVVAENIEHFQEDFKQAGVLPAFLARFPFEQLLNCSCTDPEKLCDCIKVIDFLSNYDQFYSNFQSSTLICVEFAITNLSLIQTNRPEVVLLLELLVKIISRISDLQMTSYTACDRERLVEVMSRLAEINAIEKSTATYYCRLLHCIWDMTGNMPDYFYDMVSKLFAKFKAARAVTEMCKLCKDVLERSDILRSQFNEIFNWLTEECSLLLGAHEHNEELLEAAFSCLGIFEANYLSIYQNLETNNFSKNLLTVSSAICLHVWRPSVTEVCWRLLELALVKFFASEDLPPLKNQIGEHLTRLSLDVRMWARSDVDWFFSVCHMTMLHSECLWTGQQVLESITNCFYTRRGSLGIHIFKSIFFLYPVFAPGRPTNAIIATTGTDLLFYLTQNFPNPNLYSSDIRQLRWILASSNEILKLKVLRFWLKKLPSNEKLLTSAVKDYEAEDFLLKILIDDLGQETATKAKFLINKINSPKLASNISLMMPYVWENRPLFNELLLAEPGVRLDSQDALLISTFMGVILPSLDDEQVIRGACKFCVKLLMNCEKKFEAITEFCRKLRNIQYLINICANVSGDTFLEIIRLLTTLVRLQRRTKVKFEGQLMINFNIFLKAANTPASVNRSVLLLHYVLFCRNCFMIPDINCFQELYRRMLHLTVKPELAESTTNCIVALMQQQNWLVNTVSSSIFIELRCSKAVNFPQAKHFLNLLFWWLKIIKKMPFNGFCPIPDVAIRSFLHRTSDLQEDNTQEYLDLLADVMLKNKLNL